MRRRRGVALVAAVGLLMLAAALLAGSAVASVELRRATRGVVAAARAESEGRRALGEVMHGWDASADSLPVGALLERTIPPPRSSGPPVLVRARIRRLTSSLYVVSVAVRVGDGAHVFAFRRMRLLLERPSRAGGAGAESTVAPLARWSVVDLH